MLTLSLTSLVLISYFYFFTNREVEREVVSVLTPAPTKEATTQTPVIFKLKPQETVTPSRKEPSKKHEASNVVSFEVKEGFATAYGDIILGIPEDESVKTGNYEMPLPEYWDKPEIPYAIDADLTDPSRVTTALRHIEYKTGVKFIPYDNQKDALVFQKGKEHCLSALGRRGGLQPIRISPKCSWNEITHEVLHSMGFIHEQSRPDRDKYVSVLWENIDDKYKTQFEMLPYEFMGPAKDTDFDYESVMLYGTHFFVKQDGLTNMSSLTPAPINPSQNGMSLGDVKRLKKQYRLD